jgi:maleate isomerase
MAQRQDFRRIGLLLPSSNTVQEADLVRMLPPATTVHTTRLTLTTVDQESTLAIVAELERESRKLLDADVDVILFAATAPSSRNGAGYDRKLIERITGATGKPATTASTALIEALRVLNMRRIVYGAAWSKEVNATAVKFVEEHGIEIVAADVLGVVRNQEIGLLEPETARDMARRIDRPEAQAIVLACGNWRAAEVIDEIEQELGKPVLTTNQVSLWHTLHLMNAPPLSRYGCLMREHLGGPTWMRRAS